MKLFLIIFIILFLIFIPIPLKITASYTLNDYYIKLYKLTIFSKKSFEKETDEKEVPSGEKKVSKFNLKNINYKVLLSEFYFLRFKPLLKIHFNLDYSFCDAARTAIFYGILCDAPPLIYELVNIPFKSTKFDFNINPIFQDKFLLKFESSSIFFFSIANIIYMSFILLKFVIKAREVTPS